MKLKVGELRTFHINVENDKCFRKCPLDFQNELQVWSSAAEVTFHKGKSIFIVLGYKSSKSQGFGPDYYHILTEFGPIWIPEGWLCANR